MMFFFHGCFVVSKAVIFIQNRSSVFLL